MFCGIGDPRLHLEGDGWERFSFLHAAKGMRSIPAAVVFQLRDEQVFGSTTWEWRKVKITRRTPAQQDRRGAASSSPALRQWPRRDPITITVRSRGGAESWWEVRARGRTHRFPGWVTLEDVMAQVHGGR